MARASAPRVAHALPLRGFVRADGSVGFRNYVLLISLVDLANEVTRRIADAVPDAVALLSPAGNLSFGREAALLARLRRGLAMNPNVGAVLAIAPVPEMARSLAQDLSERGIEPQLLALVNFRDSHSATAAGIRLAKRARAALQPLRRRPGGLSCLRLGLRSSASTAESQRLVNPVVGELVDRVTDAGGTVVFTEVADLAAVASKIIARAASPGTANAAAAALETARRRLAKLGLRAPDPTPLNIGGGIATLREKGEGALLRLGAAPLASVIRYGTPVTRSGLHMIDGPGSAWIGLIGLAASGCTMIVHTVGRTSIVADAPLAPSLRIGPASLARSRDLDLIIGRSRDPLAALQAVLARTAAGRAGAEEHQRAKAFMLPNFLPPL